MPGDDPVDRCGSASLAVHLAQGVGHMIYILVCDKIVSTVVLTERKSNTTYVSYVDSSGHGRGFSTDFVVAVLRSVPGLVVCFSYPKKEPILGGSSGNPKKNIMGPRELFDYWCRVFGRRCSSCRDAKGPLCLRSSMGDGAGRRAGSAAVKRPAETGAGRRCEPARAGGDACCMCTWSNFTSLKSCPYESLDEIEMFDDDPKSKMISSFKKVKSSSLSDVFEGLLVRSDFSKGGLLFSRCFKDRATASGQAPVKKHAPASGAGEEENTPDHGENSASGENTSGVLQEEIKEAMQRLSSVPPASSADRVFQMRARLQASDFSNKDGALRSTARFVEEFEILLRYFETGRRKGRETVK